MKYSQGFAVTTLVLVITLVATVGVGAFYIGKVTSDKKYSDSITYQERTVINEVVTQNKLPKTDNTPTEQVLTQAQATSLALSAWSNNCPDGDCANLSASITKKATGQYIVIMLFPQRDDSVKTIRKEAVATYQNGSWTLSSATTTQSCQLNRGHQEFTTEPCK